MSLVFVSFPIEQTSLAQQIQRQLRERGIQVWGIPEQLMPGTQAWKEAIRKGLRDIDIVIYLASPEARISKIVETELEVAQSYRKPLILVWVSGESWGNSVPHHLVNMQFFDARGGRHQGAMEQLIANLERLNTQFSLRAAHSQPLFEESYPLLAQFDLLGFMGSRDAQGVPYIVPPVSPVPAGKFTMGSSFEDTLATDEEKPQYRIEVGAFEIGLYPVTVAEYTLAVNAGAVSPPGESMYATGPKIIEQWRGKTITWDVQQQRPDHPVVSVSWEDARDYCHWLSLMTGQTWRLPREVEWEKAARWDAQNQSSRVYPWGNSWDASRANTDEGGPGLTTPVGAYTVHNDASPYGCHDMAGNVWEWTSTLWYPRPPYDALASEQEMSTSLPHVVRGGSWISNPKYARAAFRIYNSKNRYVSIGFRLVRVS
jgi:formylglycine-generating enzyme required for sulfatase activity